MHKLLIPFLVSLLTILFKPPVIIRNSVDVSSSLVGPFEKFDKNTNITFDYLYQGTNETLYEQFKVFDYGTNELLTKTVTSWHSASNKSWHTFTIPLKLRNLLSESGLLLNLQIFSTNELLFDETVELFPITHDEIDVVHGKTDRIVSRTVAFEINNSVVKKHFDDFNFVDFEDYINADNYYTLDIDKSRFLYNNSSLLYHDATISIVDERRILKNFFHDNEGKINLPVLITDNGEEKRFKYKNKFYVDRLNLETADYQLPEYVQTDKLYLPVNKKDDFLGTQIIFKITDAGYNKYNINVHLTYDIVRGLLGNCNSSDYCIKGEVE